MVHIQENTVHIWLIVQKLSILPRLDHVDPTNKIDLLLLNYRVYHLVPFKCIPNADFEPKTTVVEQIKGFTTKNELEYDADFT